MKHTILFLAILCCSMNAFSQKATVLKGASIKHKKITNILGSFTIGGKPFLLVGESTRMIVDQSAVFYPVEDDMTLGEPIRQENVNIIDGEMTLEKCIYIENIIVSDGKTFLFYTKRKGSNGKVYVVELGEDCIINQDEATEVMALNLGFLAKNTNFDVQLSPDGSKVLLVGMVKKTQKSSDFYFKVYQAGMNKLLWTKDITAPALSDGNFKSSDEYNTAANVNNDRSNNFLINNLGRVYFLIRRTNPSETKEDYKFLSLDEKGNSSGEIDVLEPGNWMGSWFFNLEKNGKARLTFFYSKEPKMQVRVGDVDPVNKNALSVIEFDGFKVTNLYDHQYNNDEMMNFYPMKSRKVKSDYKLTGFNLSNIYDLENGNKVMLIEKSYSTVGDERPMSSNSNGFVTVLFMDSNYNLIKTYAYLRNSFIRGYTGMSQSSAAYVQNGVFYLCHYNEKQEVVYLRFDGPEKVSTLNLMPKILEEDGVVCFTAHMSFNGGFILPIRKDANLFNAFIK